jgi:hypothetical protein
MSTYSDHEQRMLDQQSGAELDRQAERREAKASNEQLQRALQRIVNIADDCGETYEELRECRDVAKSALSASGETGTGHTAHCLKRLDDIGCDCGSGHTAECQLVTARCTCGADDVPAQKAVATADTGCKHCKCWHRDGDGCCYCDTTERRTVKTGPAT